MFESLSEKLAVTFKKLRGHGKLSEQNIQEAMREVRLSLLEADVNFRVVKDLIESIRPKVIGQDVLMSLTPAQQVIKIVHQELAHLMGDEESTINVSGRPPASIMVVGLQGSGKTTTIGKLAKLLSGQKHRPLLVPTDVYRPAAIDQLCTLGEDLGLRAYPSDPAREPIAICKDAIRMAEAEDLDVVLIDTAGRWHVDEEMMAELKQLKEAVLPREVLLVADAMTGQEAVNVALTFDAALDIDGIILTKMDGDARGGAALSMRAVTHKPIKFIGVGEKPEAIEVFHPDRMASRILGMGDVLSLIEKAEVTFDLEKAAQLEKKLRKDSFTLEDFREQLISIKKMGSLEDLIAMIPGMNPKAMKAMGADEKELVRVEAILNSMTGEERANPSILSGSRRIRIARGSGTTVQDINRLIKRYGEARKMLKTLRKGRMGRSRAGLPFSL